MDGFQTKTPKRPKLDYPHGDARPELGETIQVAPGIEWVSMPLPFSLKFINLWLIDDGESWTIVDTGLPLLETRTAWKSLIEARITPEKPLKRVMVTHMHPDHVGCAGWLCHKYGAELWMSRLEYITCRMLVSDTGPGIDPAIQGEIFKPFFTTRKQGVGLGLNICKRIAEDHGGKLTAANNPSGGAIFELCLPSAITTSKGDV